MDKVLFVDLLQIVLDDGFPPQYPSGHVSIRTGFYVYQGKLFYDNLPQFKFNLQCYDSTLTSDAFLTTLKMSTNMDEVRSVLQKVEEEMARARSKDTGGVDGQS